MNTPRSDSARERLPNRRGSINFNFECGTFTCIATVSFFPDGRLAEIFLGNGKTGSTADAIAKDSAVVASIALQYGVPLEVIRRALLRDSQGRASGPLGTAFDLIAEGSRAGIRFADARCSEVIDEAAE